MSSRIIIFAVLLALSSAARADLSSPTPILVSTDAMLQSMDPDGVLQLPQRDVIDVVGGSLENEPHPMALQRVRITFGQPVERSGWMTTNDVLHGQHVRAANVDVEPVAKWGRVNPFVHDRMHVVYESAGLVGINAIDRQQSKRTDIDRRQDVKLDDLPWPTFKELSEADPRSQGASSYPTADRDFLDPASDMHAWDDKRWSQAVSLEAQSRQILLQNWRDRDRDRYRDRDRNRSDLDRYRYRDWDRERCRSVNRW